MNRTRNLIGGLAALCFAAAVLTPLCGCVGWATYPPVKGADLVARNDPNQPPMDEIMYTSLKWVSEKYPPNFGTPQANEPDQKFAVNLPSGMKPQVYMKIVGKAGPNAEPLTPATKDLPIYHIVRIRVRGAEANVDVLRPAREFGPGPNGQPVYQGMTVYLDGGWRSWHVVRRAAWEPGVLPVPELAFYEPPPPQPVRPAGGNPDRGNE
jgi:hypothetical protein